MAEVIVSSIGNLAQRIDAGNHQFFADEPTDGGGQDTGPDPYSLLLAALGACTSMTLQLYASRKGWPLERVEVSLRHSRTHAQDCQNCGKSESKLERIDRYIHVTGELSAEQRMRLLEIAQRCPVHRTLRSEILIEDYLD
jgi:uncharacterized OsmC-like protein